MLLHEKSEALWNRMTTEQARQREFIEALEKAIIELSIQYFPRLGVVTCQE